MKTMYIVIIMKVFGGVEEVHDFGDKVSANEFILGWCNGGDEKFTTAEEGLDWFRDNQDKVDFAIQLVEINNAEESVLKWNDCSVLPTPNIYVLLTFESHFGQAFTVGLWDDAQESWYVVADEDGTMSRVSEIELEKWSYFDGAKNDNTAPREDFMAFFRSDSFHESVSVDDAKEIFRGVLHGSSDITKELLTETASDYEVNVLGLFSVKELMDEIARRAVEEGVVESASSLSLMTSEKAQWGVKQQLHKCNGVDIGNDNYYVDPQEYVGKSDIDDLVEKANRFGIALINVY